MVQQETYNADEQTKTKLPSEIIIGGRKFLVKRTGKALKRIIEIETDSVEYEIEQDEAGKDRIENDQPVWKRDEKGERIEKDDPGASVSLVYTQLSVVLVDPEKAEDPDETKRHPDPDWLEEVLDFEIAGEMMEMFVPMRARAEGNATSSNASETPLPEQSSSASEPKPSGSSQNLSSQSTESVS